VQFGLREICDQPADQFFTRRGGFCSPGCWAALIARAANEGLTLDALNLSDEHRGYLEALRAEAALGHADTYRMNRPGQGERYSPIIALRNEASVDSATSCMQDCVRHLLNNQAPAAFVDTMCDVVGDLHDNVWSHALSPGYSVAQRWRGYRSHNELFEFALADCGLGFLGELRRSGVAQEQHIETDEQAIGWCVVEGNSSKPGNDDEWAQRVPEDAIGNPMPGTTRAGPDNHHLGLGLAKLTGAVRRFGGQLWLASGRQILQVAASGTETYVPIRNPWQGVALACRFDMSLVARAPQQEVDPVVEDIARLLRERAQP